MNEVARQLADKAHLQPYYAAQEQHISAFADLIVQECIGVCQKAGNPMSATYATPYQIEEAIRKHFGIK